MLLIKIVTAAGNPAHVSLLTLRTWGKLVINQTLVLLLGSRPLPDKKYDYCYFHYFLSYVVDI